MTVALLAAGRAYPALHHVHQATVIRRSPRRGLTDRSAYRDDWYRSGVPPHAMPYA